MHSRGIMLSVLLLVVTDYHTAFAKLNQCTGEDGCIDIRDCERFSPHYNEPGKWSGTLKIEFRKRVCKREVIENKIMYKVCCSNIEVGEDNLKRGLEFLDQDTCGKYSGDRIAFGKTATLFQFPWMALLKADSSSANFLCSGTLINERYVLTAAHCLKNIKIKYVRLGEYDLSTNIDCDEQEMVCAPEPQDIPPERIIYHEDYSNKRKVHDIGLIRLARKAILNTAVAPICLPVSRAMRTEQLKYTVAGWGQTHDSEFANKLQYTTLRLMSNGECEDSLKTYYRWIKIYDNKMCTIDANLSNHCTGDSGGPLATISVSGRYTQYGVVAYGLRGCGEQRAPGVYTRVENHIDWILSNLDE